MEWPIIQIDNLYHVGTLDKTQKRKNSHEGDGLSVSTHPEAWERINRFTVGKTYQCIKENNTFLDKHNLTSHHLDRITAWGLEKGWVIPCVYYRMTFYNEYEEECYSDFRTKGEAEYEGEEDEADITCIPNGIVMSQKMQDKMVCSEQELDPIEKLAVLYAEHVLGIDGVWWEDCLAVHQYSAPRGVIVDSRIAEWAFKAVAHE